jgi:voltage-gated potassium channel
VNRDTANRKPRDKSFRRRVYLALEGAGTAGTIVEVGLVALILANVVAFTLQSVPSILGEFPEFFIPFEAFSIGIFTIEYAMRLWCAPEDPRYRNMGVLAGRVQYALTPMMVIDFFAVAPGYVALFVPVLDLRFLRLVRLLRLLKIARYSPALSTLAQVIIDERRALVGSLLLLFCATVFAAATMHAVEGAAMPKQFGTIPGAMWWAIQTLTTVGYGDTVPITPAGRAVAGVTMVIGVGLIALPVGIIATGFVSTVHRRDFVVTFGMLARVPLFAGFSAGVLGEILSLLKSQTISAGGIISARGERAAAMYFIVSGEVDVELPQRTLEFGPGDFFGELALLRETMRTATVIARTPTRLLTLSAVDFSRLLRHHPALEERLKTAPALRAFAESSEIAQAEVDAAGTTRDEVRVK